MKGRLEKSLTLVFVTLITAMASVNTYANTNTGDLSGEQFAYMTGLDSEEQELTAEEIFGYDNAKRVGIIESASVFEKALRDYTLAHYQAVFPDAHIEVHFNSPLPDIAGRGCDHEPIFQAPRYLNRSGNSLMNISCKKPEAWKVFVPAGVNVSQEVIIAVGPISRNAPLNAGNTATRLVNLDSFRDQYVTDLSQLSGKVALRNMRSGQVIRTDLITEPVLVRRGDRVMIQAFAGDTSVKMLGTALGAGKRGEQIRVRNGSSERIVIGKITAQGQVTVRM